MEVDDMDTSTDSQTWGKLPVGTPPMTKYGFVGRQHELDELCSLLMGQARLVTLTGPGGIGKTRLATEAVQRIRKARHTPAFWVHLARLPGGVGALEVAKEVTRTVASTEDPDHVAWRSTLDVMTRTDAVGRQLPTLLILDNCEHVLDATGEVIAELLEAVPGLTVLATSREPIAWTDERVVTVPPLSKHQAVELFHKRAELTGHVVEENQSALVSSICAHVHRNPLFVQLAASRLVRQPLPVILRELTGAIGDRRMRWTHGPRVGVEPRHRSVEEAIAWSYDLCSEPERILLERMSVFAAGCDSNPLEDNDFQYIPTGIDVAAVRAICADDPDAGTDALLDREDIEELLFRLVDQSLVSAQRGPDSVRYFLLETTRVFAWQRLEARSSTEAAALAARHLRYFRDRVVDAAEQWASPAEQELLDWARAGWANILAAIERSLATPHSATLGLEIATGLIAMRVPFFRGTPLEIACWAERALHASGGVGGQPAELGITAAAMICWVRLCQGSNEAAARLLDECVSAATDVTTALNWRQRTNAELELPAPVEFAWGAELLFVHRDPRAVQALSRAREKWHARGDRAYTLLAEMCEALAASLLTQTEQAVHTARRHLENARASGATGAQAAAELVLAIALTKNGDPNQALALTRSALTYQTRHLDCGGGLLAVHVRAWSLAHILADLIAGTAPNRDRVRILATEIAHLVGGASASTKKLASDLGVLAPFAEETRRAIDVAHGVLGAERYNAAVAEGATLRPEFGEVQRLALGLLTIAAIPLHHGRRNVANHWTDLSTAEQQVAILAAAGWTNTAIAARRGSAAKTVDTQMTSIFRKLTITSREDIIRFVPESEIHRVRTESARKPDRSHGRALTGEAS
ncbi:ATP-binding protein [Nocardia brasiliensis]|uniref:ATP-binding protein n=1 Tax=Nocardia brasiliensis TaxID=37326 RepID=UPI0024575011|nr:AAA family ATPase [Nocardia brasiliensis]